MQKSINIRIRHFNSDAYRPLHWICCIRTTYWTLHRLMVTLKLPPSNKWHFPRMHRCPRQMAHHQLHHPRPLQRLPSLRPHQTQVRPFHTSIGSGIRISFIHNRETFTMVSCRTRHNCRDFLPTNREICVHRMNRWPHWKPSIYLRPVIASTRTVIVIH